MQCGVSGRPPPGRTASPRLPAARSALHRQRRFFILVVSRHGARWRRTEGSRTEGSRTEGSRTEGSRGEHAPPAAARSSAFSRSSAAFAASSSASRRSSSASRPSSPVFRRRAGAGAGCIGGWLHGLVAAPSRTESEAHTGRKHDATTTCQRSRVGCQRSDDHRWGWSIAIGWSPAQVVVAASWCSEPGGPWGGAGASSLRASQRCRTLRHPAGWNMHMGWNEALVEALGTYRCRLWSMVIFFLKDTVFTRPKPSCARQCHFC